MMRRIVYRTAGLTLGFALLAMTLTGCFQPVGAALEPTAIKLVAAVPQVDVATPTPDITQTALADLYLTSVAETLTAAAPSETPAPPSETPTETTTPTDTVEPSITPTPRPDLPTALPSFTPVPPTPTLFVPVVPTETPFQVAVLPSSTNTALPPTVAPSQTPVPPTATPLPPTATLVPPSDTPLPPAQISSPTLPPLFIPTLSPEEAAAFGIQANVAPPVNTEAPAVVAQAPTVDTQATLFAQATQIIAIVTQTAAANATATSVAQGTPIIPGGPTPIVPGFTPLAPIFTPLPGTATFPPGTPGLPGSGAAGPIDAGCRYTVVTGDRLLRIALRFNTGPSAIARANGIINQDLLQPGQVLIIPNCGLQPLPPTLPPVGVTQTLPPNVTVIVVTATVEPGGTRVHVVQEGENLWRIARRYGVTVTSIAQVNGIANINLVYIGQQLVIP